MALAARSIDTEAYGKGAPPPNIELRQHLDARVVSLEDQRYSWWVHWAQLARYILPRRYRWLVTPNQYDRGVPINQNILDSTGGTAARVLANGMMSGLTSPSRPWFRLDAPDQNLSQDREVKEWLAEVQKRMMRVMGSSNYYTSKAVQYNDLVVFGTAPMIIYEDYDNIIRCYNPCAGEYYCALGARLSVDTLYRKITMTCQQVVDEFGYDACSEGVKQAWRTRGASLDREVTVYHAIEPNPEYVADATHIGPGGIPRNFRWRECWWEQASAAGALLRQRGFYEAPFSCPRWDVSGNDAYGRSPGMDALGDIMQLQLETKRKAQAIDKMVNPPMVASVAMKNEPASLLPGAVTYSSDPKDGFRPAYQVNPYLGDMLLDIREVQERIRRVFYNDLFLMISQLETVRTATEIDARREEQLIQLGPVVERNENEGLSPDINRIYHIMDRKGLFPKAPEALVRAGGIKVEYVSMFSDIQRNTATTAIERWWAVGGNIAAAKPDVLDLMSADETMLQMADLLRVPPKIVTSPQQVAATRAARAKQRRDQAMAAAADAGVQGAQTLSETEVGGGQNALQLMLQGTGRATL